MTWLLTAGLIMPSVAAEQASAACVMERKQRTKKRSLDWAKRMMREAMKIWIGTIALSNENKNKR